MKMSRLAQQRDSQKYKTASPDRAGLTGLKGDCPRAQVTWDFTK